MAGGAYRDRTDAPLLAKQVLSQLSYAPKPWWAWVDLNYRPHAYQACALTKLSYRPRLKIIQPLTKVNTNAVLARERDTETANCLSAIVLKNKVMSHKTFMGLSLKGGDPAAGSPTATLLRLHPSR